MFAQKAVQNKVLSVIYGHSFHYTFLDFRYVQENTKEHIQEEIRKRSIGTIRYCDVLTELRYSCLT
jgi:hypothetical protein